jgi:2,3-bisphosphoglycerate-independent phosphoglycerate mutase
MTTLPTPRPPRPVLLCVLDGWGCRGQRADNAIAQAQKPVWDRLIALSPHATADASEHHVGLPDGQMGNSEVGHMNLGAGRVVMQDLPRIDAAFAAGEVAKLPAFRALVEALRRSGGACHLIGLLSPGGVHSHQSHLAALARALDAEGIPVRVHGLLDGRDTPPRSAAGFVARFLADIAGCRDVRLATLGGRYYAMDRDQRWERVALAYDCLVEGKGETAADPVSAIDAAYARGENDEFVRPTVLAGYRGMRDGDGLLCGNFRADRVRQILAALLDPGFAGFARPRIVRFAAAVGLASYGDALKPFLQTLFEPMDLSQTLGEVVATAGLRQLRIAETEKYAHVTFFFNGGEEKLFAGEERILVPSPKVATYDLQPEMSAPEVTDKLVAAIESGRFDLIVCNFANTDMVGHSGDLAAATKAVEAVDACLGRLERAIRAAGGCMLVTADHGNAETMRDPETGAPHTAHTLNRVPVLLVNPPAGVAALADGELADIAPTLLELLGLEQPAQMTGRSLLRHGVAAHQASGQAMPSQAERRASA